MRKENQEITKVQDRLTPVNSPGTGNTRGVSNEKVGQLNEKKCLLRIFSGDIKQGSAQCYGV